MIALRIGLLLVLGLTLALADDEVIKCPGGECVKLHLCRDGSVVTDGSFLIDIRFNEDDPCEHYLLKCCAVPDSEDGVITEPHSTGDAEFIVPPSSGSQSENQIGTGSSGSTVMPGPVVPVVPSRPSEPSGGHPSDHGREQEGVVVNPGNYYGGSHPSGGGSFSSTYSQSHSSSSSSSSSSSVSYQQQWTGPQRPIGMGTGGGGSNAGGLAGYGTGQTGFGGQGTVQGGSNQSGIKGQGSGQGVGQTLSQGSHGTGGQGTAQAGHGTSHSGFNSQGAGQTGQGTGGMGSFGQSGGQLGPSGQGTRPGQTGLGGQGTVQAGQGTSQSGINAQSAGQTLQGTGGIGSLGQSGGQLGSSGHGSGPGQTGPGGQSTAQSEHGTSKSGVYAHGAGQTGQGTGGIGSLEHSGGKPGSIGQGTGESVPVKGHGTAQPGSAELGTGQTGIKGQGQGQSGYGGQSSSQAGHDTSQLGINAQGAGQTGQGTGQTLSQGGHGTEHIGSIGLGSGHIQQTGIKGQGSGQTGTVGQSTAQAGQGIYQSGISTQGTGQTGKGSGSHGGGQSGTSGQGTGQTMSTGGVSSETLHGSTGGAASSGNIGSSSGGSSAGGYGNLPLNLEGSNLVAGDLHGGNAGASGTQTTGHSSQGHGQSTHQTEQFEHVGSTNAYGGQSGAYQAVGSGQAAAGNAMHGTSYLVAGVGTVTKDQARDTSIINAGTSNSYNIGQGQTLNYQFQNNNSTTTQSTHNIGSNQGHGQGHGQGHVGSGGHHHHYKGDGCTSHTQKHTPIHTQHPDFVKGNGDDYTDTTVNPILPPRENVGCGYRNPDGVGFRITGNSDGESEYGEFPWMVAILKEEKALDQVINVYQCGGSLIHPRVILTAAHCVQNKKPHEIKVRLGEWDTQTTNEIHDHQDRNVAEIVVHDKFYKGGLFNDFGLLFLDKPAEIMDTVNTVCLPPQDFNFDLSRCFASGWGKDVFGKEGTYQVILKKIDLPVMPFNKCQDALRTTRLGKRFILNKSFICAGGEPKKDTCKGDGGSPLVCPIPGSPNRYYQAGIVAWGIGCGEDGIPGVYANVAAFRSWIDEHLTQRSIPHNYYIAV